MDQVLTQVRKVTDLMGEISASTAQQTHGIVQVSEAVAADRPRPRSRTRRWSRRAAAAAESLRQQAMALTQAIARFKVRGMAGA